MSGIICRAIQIYSLVVIARIVLEYVPVTSDHPVARIRRAFRSVTDPVLQPLRAILPPVRLGGVGIDLSPLVLLVGLSLLAGAIC
jgi:YggT family protein